MIISSSGIVLASFPYSESSVISKIFTSDHGLNTFIIKGAKSPRNKQKLAALRPLQSVEVVHYRGRSDLYLVKELRIDYPLYGISSSAEKTCIALFIAELLSKSLAENVVDQALFAFVESSIKWLEHTENHLNFHLQFLLQLSRYMGFYPKTANSFQDLLFGEMQLSAVRDSRQELTEVLNLLIAHPEYTAEQPKISNQQRRELLQTMVSFYSLHLEKPLDIKSLPVLESVFSD